MGVLALHFDYSGKFFKEKFDNLGFILFSYNSYLHILTKLDSDIGFLGASARTL